MTLLAGRQALTAERGRRAYEEDVRRQPNYPSGHSRKTWSELGHNEKDTWIRNPTPRSWGNHPT